MRGMSPLSVLTYLISRSQVRRSGDWAIPADSKLFTSFEFKQVDNWVTEAISAEFFRDNGSYCPQRDVSFLF